ncbi:BamA/TamA family outer membrane protein [Algoriphagus halophilus]|uniref:Uncharacterized protein n=1 Tax=Algoriphagus halophilus TaxID=226505 RepID=A0A1N6D5F1_9BACT|nr:hypothetical protein [Algoriphagus halophilus]SIN65963.1 hypothetical protein SAMN05444394_0247 [Algoriphagus halophilus]
MRAFIILVFSFLICAQVKAQDKKDSTKTSVSKKALEEGIKLISRTGSDSVLLEESDERFLPYSGNIIRNIYVQSIGFEKSIYGNEKPIVQKIGRTANKLHTNTREKTIRQNLFIRPNEKINPYKLGDNERHLRNQEFILESRFVITPVEETDSVDITVVTRDVFSIGMNIGGSIPTAPKFTLYDANLDGRGQRLEVTMLFDPDRKPRTGFSTTFEKTSFLGSFADLEIFYTQLNTGFSYGDEKEFATGIKIDRKLVSPYSRLAGGGQWSKNWSRNVYSRPDSVFLDYHYNLADFWIGYNFGIHKPIEKRSRTFLAARVFDGYFIDKPDQEGFYKENNYNNINGVLAALTFYKRDFYKTQYIFGFGRTEDVPYGYTITPTIGWVRRLGASKPYAALELNYKGVFESGSFYEMGINTGTFVKNSSLEDGVIYSTISFFTRVFSLGNYKLRNAAGLTYTKLFNRYANNWLEIYSELVPGLRVREIEADERYSVRIESALYTPWSLIGFRIAPFISLNAATLNCQACIQSSYQFYGFSTGLRIRNENLIFGTIELRGTYIPEDEFGSSKFSFKLRQNLRFRKSDNFVKAPSFITYNY